jgi:hypothetical protein
LKTSILTKAEIRNKKAQQKQKENIPGGKGWVIEFSEDT